MDANTISKSVLASNVYQQQISSLAALKQSDKVIATDNTSTDAAGVVSDSVQLRSSVTLKNLDTVRAIEIMHASLNQQAKGVRETNESVNKAVEQVVKMKTGLDGIVKNFPPYPLESKERNDILMQYSSLRKELLSLMVPPPPPPVYEKVKQMWGELFDQNGKIQSTNVPPLETKSNDAQVMSGTQKLENTSKQLTDFSDQVTQSLINP